MFTEEISNNIKLITRMLNIFSFLIIIQGISYYYLLYNLLFINLIIFCIVTTGSNSLHKSPSGSYAASFSLNKMKDQALEALSCLLREIGWQREPEGLCKLLKHERCLSLLMAPQEPLIREKVIPARALSCVTARVIFFFHWLTTLPEEEANG